MTTKLKETTKVFTSIFPIWSLWYIGVLLIVYIISNFFSNDGIASFFGFGMIANRTYLFVLAIMIMLMFLEWAVNMGVSRKTFFKSMFITGVVTAVFITLIAALISFGLSFTPFTGDYFVAEDVQHLSDIQYVIFQFFSALLYYAAGLLIGASFYKGFWPGMLAVLGSIAAIMALTFNESLLNYFGATENISVYFGFILVIGLIIIYNWTLYAVLKNIPIKIG